MSKKAWIIFIVIVVGAFGGLIAYSRFVSPSIDVSDIDTSAIQSAQDMNGTIGDHVLGNAESKVVLIEYGDFQCPSCAGAHPTVKEVMSEYEDRVAFVFRNFPLSTIHPNARAAAAAAEAAGLQGKYWEMFDLLFTNQTAWGSLDATARTQAFTGYAAQLSLDAERFASDLASSNVNKKISFDQALAKKLGVSSTPTFYLNGEPLDSETAGNTVQGSSTSLRQALDTALAK